MGAVPEQVAASSWEGGQTAVRAACALRLSLHDHTAGVLRPLLQAPLLTCALQRCPAGTSGGAKPSNLLSADGSSCGGVELTPLGAGRELLHPQQMPLVPGLGVQLG